MPKRKCSINDNIRREFPFIPFIPFIGRTYKKATYSYMKVSPSFTVNEEVI
jgi:hypothetical protein